MNAYNTLNQKLDIPIPPADPRSYLNQFISDIELDNPKRKRAATVLEAVAEEGICQGRNPRGVAAGAIYLACMESDRNAYCPGTTQADIADTAGVSTVTLRNARNAIVDGLNDRIAWM